MYNSTLCAAFSTGEVRVQQLSCVLIRKPWHQLQGNKQAADEDSKKGSIDCMACSALRISGA
jgi:hypothetical protein